MDNNLVYVGDSSIATMFIGNFPKETAEILKKVGNDIVRAEQYMDFIRNRRFRSTLLCKKGTSINRNIKGSRLKDFYLKSTVKPQIDVKDIDITSNVAVVFKGVRGNEFRVNDKYLITALLYMCEEKKAVSVNDIISEVKKRLGSHAKSDSSFEDALLNKMLVLIFSNNLEVLSFSEDFVTSVSSKPKASELSRYQASYTDWVTNQSANKISLDIFGRVLMQYLNGENTIEDIIAKMKKHVLKKELTIKDSGNIITDEKIIEEKLKIFVNETLDKMVRSAVLVA